MALAAREVRAVAIDLPGIGGSPGDATDGSKRQLAEVVRRLIAALELDHPTIVGHDAGGMVAYAYLRWFTDLDRLVIMDTVSPGVDPWDDVLRNPYIWHFAMHSIAALPEHLAGQPRGEPARDGGHPGALPARRQGKPARSSTTFAGSPPPACAPSSTLWCPGRDISPRKTHRNRYGN